MRHIITVLIVALVATSAHAAGAKSRLARQVPASAAAAVAVQSGSVVGSTAPAPVASISTAPAPVPASAAPPGSGSVATPGSGSAVSPGSGSVVGLSGATPGSGSAIASGSGMPVSAIGSVIPPPGSAMGSQQGSAPGSSSGPVSAGSIGSMAPQGSLSLSAAPASGSGSSLVTTQPASTGSSSVSGSESGESSSKSESSGESSSKSESSRRRRCRNKKNKKCLYDIKEIEYLHPDIKAILPPREGGPDGAPADDKKGFFKFAQQITVKSVGIPDAITVGGDDNKRKAGLDTHFQLTSQTPDVMKYDRDFDLNHGLAPTMSVSTIQIRKAEKLAPEADKKHYEFEDQHKKDCAGPICPKKGPE